MIDAPYPDMEAMLVALLAGHFDLPGQRIGTTRPADVNKRAAGSWYLRLYASGGGGEVQGTTDVPMVAVDVFSDNRTRAWDAARDVRAVITAGRHRVPGHGVVDRGELNAGPNEISDPSSTLRLVTALYAVSARRATV